MAGRMVYREVDAPLEHIGIHGAGRAFILAGDNLHPVAAAESIVETHALERMGLTWVGARKACQLVFANPISDLENTMLFHVKAQHDNVTCEGARRARGEDVAPLRDGSKGMTRWRCQLHWAIYRSIGITQ